MDSNNKLLRVTQMNAIYLDNEIYRALHQIVQDVFRSLPPGFVAPFESEVNLLLRLCIVYNSVVKSGATFGQQLLTIKYESMNSFQQLLYFVPCCFDYLKSKIERLLPSSDLNNTLFNIDVAVKIMNLINLSIFLRNGQKPLLIERLLGLNQTFAVPNAHRQFESKYLARELLWNGFIEILIYILPLINYQKIKRTFRNYNVLRKRKATSVVPSRNITMHTKCAYCGENPILPHHMGCSHIFCYVCLKGNQTADSKFECPVCEHRNPNTLCDMVTVM